MQNYIILLLYERLLLSLLEI